MDNWGIVVQFLTREANFSVFISILGPTPPFIEWVLGALSTGVKWSGSKPDHSFSCSAHINNEWRFTPISPIHLHDRQRRNFIFHSILLFTNCRALHRVSSLTYSFLFLRVSVFINTIFRELHSSLGFLHTHQMFLSWGIPVLYVAMK